MLKKFIRPAFILIFLLSVILNIVHYDKEFSSAVKEIEANKYTSYEFVCRICGYPVSDTSSVKVYADILRSDFPYDLTGKRLLINAPREHLYDMQYGCSVRLKGNISAANDELNKGCFNYRRYLESKNTVGIFKKNQENDLEFLGKSKSIISLIYKFRTRVITTLRKYFRGDEAGLIIAMLTGERGFISDKMSDAYKKAGIYHIVAVSGLHAGIFISLISFAMLLIPMKTTKKNLLVRFTGIIAATVLYLFTGFGISITRVIFMMTVMFFAFLIRREYNILTAIPFTGAVILIIMPWEFYSQSFQLSFLSTFGLCLALKIFKDKIPDNDLGKYVFLPLVMSTGATLATLCVSAYNYRMISLSGVFTNLIAVPLATFLLCSVLGFSLVAELLPEIASHLLSFVVYTPAKLINELSVFIANQEYSHINVLPGKILAISAMAFMTTVGIFAFRKGRKTASVVILAVVISGFVMYNTNSSHTKVTFINAGKGESVMIQTPDRKTTLIDCGSVAFTESAENVFKPYLSHAGVSHIDKLFISYFDDEHTNAINILMRDGYIKELVLPPETEETKESVLLNRRKILDSAKKYGIKYSHISHGNSVPAGKNTEVYLHYENSELKNKNACAVYRINCKDVSFLLSSCLGAKGQELFSEQSNSCTVLKTPNYGQTVKATKNYILSAEPEYAVVTLPRNDKYIKFDNKLDDILSKEGIPYGRTDINKTITFITDGEEIKSVELRKGELN